MAGFRGATKVSHTLGFRLGIGLLQCNWVGAFGP
jgi:hypothetical protein